jgi:flagellin-like hook-associated protein FlgL
LVEELNSIATSTTFNDVQLLDGTYDQDMRVGNTNPEVVRVTIDGMGINKHIQEESYAFGQSTQILSPLENAIGSSAFNLKANSFGLGEMDPVYLASATASGISSFDTPNFSSASNTSSNPVYLITDTASGSSSYNVLNQSSAVATINTPEYNAFTNAEIRNASLSTTSKFTTVGFNNGNFEDGTATQNGNVVSIPGWDIHLETAFLDGRPFDIGGWQTPLDTLLPPNFAEEITHNTLEANFQNTDISTIVQDGALYLRQGGGSQSPGYHVARGPYVVSQEAVSLEVGDSVSFEWFGLSGGDAYDVFGYLLNEDTGNAITLLNETGTSSGASTQQLGMGVDGWVTASNSVNVAGDYKFVFIAGTFDLSGGLYSGNGLALRNVDVQLANPPIVTDLTAKVSVQAIESDEVRIASNLLTSAQSTVTNDPGGIFTILTDGFDHTNFTINAATGDITSVGPLRYDVQDTYQFTVRYAGPNGTQHDETVTLRLTPFDEAYSEVTVQESGQVIIDPNQLTGFQKFMDFEANRAGGQVLTYTLEAYTDHDLNPANNGNPNDYLQFRIDQISGQITSNSALDFSDDQDYHFNIRALAADGRTYLNHVVVNLTDTFDSTATFEVEETDQIVLNLSDLTSSADFESRYGGGAYTIGPGLDGGQFSIVGGQIIANDNFRLPNKPSYTFDVVYTSGADVHTERVTIDLTRYLQSDTVLTAHEAGRVNISRSAFTELDAFAAADGYAGGYTLHRYDNNDGNPANDGDADDYLQIQANGDGSFYIDGADFTTENQFHFNLQYNASDGRVFTDRVILNLTDTLSSTASMHVEEANQMVINIADLTASSTYAGLNPGGTFSIGNGSGLFSVVGNQVIANKEFRKEEQNSYNFELIYTHGATQHRENVTVDLTRFMQSQGTFVADEAQQVILSAGEFDHLFSFANDNLSGTYTLTGADAALFRMNDSGDVISRNPLDYDVQQNYNFNITYTTNDGRVFNSQIQLGLEDTLASKATLSCEEAQIVIANGNLLTSLQAHALKDGNQGTFELLEMGNHDKFTMAADGTLTSTGELRMSENPVLNIYIKYNGVGVDDLVEHVEITLTPTNYDHSRSHFTATESDEVVIVPQLNPYMRAYAEADNFAGRWEIVQSPYAQDIDTAFFEVADNKGQLRTIQRMDFESGKTDFEITLLYHHSSNTKKYTDFLHLNIINDKRDDNNLALEGIDISTREGAAAAAEHLQLVVDRINNAQAKLGAIQNRFTHNIENLSTIILKSEQASGRITDADFALESTNLARTQILQQASTDMLLQANRLKENVLMLLQ